MTRFTLLLALAAASTANALAEEPRRFIQDRFAIGFWVDPPADEKMGQRYAEIAEANFTLVIGGFGARTPDAVRRQLELCEKHDLKAIVHPCGLEADRLPESDACWGYILQDEPHPRDFPGLRARVDAIREARPGRLAYINLFPNYATAEQLGTDTYEEHVDRFIREVNVDVLSMDHYPMMTPDIDEREGYCRNLETMRTASLAAGIPFWNFFHTMPFSQHIDPTEAQIRWQIYTSLAYGAKGVLYFCYYTPQGPIFDRNGAIITRDDRRTRHYDQAKRINAALRNLGPTLMKLTSTRVIRIRPDDNPETLLAGAPIRDLTPGDFLVGTFRHADGRRAVMLNNYHFAYTAWPTVEFDAPLRDVREVRPRTGRIAPLLDDSPDLEGMQISLDAGQGRLFLLPAE